MKTLTILMIGGFAVVAVLALPHAPDTTATTTRTTTQQPSCNVKDIPGTIGLIGKNPLACFQQTVQSAGSGNGTMNQVYLTYQAGAFSQLSQPAPSPVMQDEAATSYSDATTKTYTIQHRNAADEVLWTGSAAFGTQGLLQVIYKDAPGIDSLVILQGQSIVFRMDLA